MTTTAQTQEFNQISFRGLAGAEAYAQIRSLENAVGGEYQEQKLKQVDYPPKRPVRRPELPSYN
jgi:hypothetical protein